jgi:hypothetical protein
MSGMPPAADAAPLEILHLDAAEAGRHPTLCDEIFAGQRLGAIVRRVFDAAQMERVVDRLERGETALRRYPSEHFDGMSWGRPLVVWGDRLEGYFDDAAGFDDAAAALFAGGPGFRARVEEVLGALAGGAPLRVPAGPRGAPYLPATIRRVTPGGQIHLHCENETLGFPAMRHLATVIDPATQLSYYVVLATPERGGELLAYGVRHGVGPGRMLERMERSTEETFAAIAPWGHAALDAGVGDLLLFDAGRHFHRVSPVEGASSRWTMGGFVARTRDHRALLYWS